MKKIIRTAMALVLSILFILALPMGVSAAETRELIVAGTPFGVKIRTAGVIVVGIPNENGPAAEAGLKRGDVITAINGEAIESAEEFYPFTAGLLPKEAAARYLEEGALGVFIKSLEDEDQNTIPYVLVFWKKS